MATRDSRSKFVQSTEVKLDIVGHCVIYLSCMVFALVSCAVHYSKAATFSDVMVSPTIKTPDKITCMVTEITYEMSM